MQRSPVIPGWVGEEGNPEDFPWSRLGVVAKAAVCEGSPLLRNDSLMPLCSQCHHREECSLRQAAPWKQVCQRDLGTKAHQTASRYQAVVFVSRAGPAACSSMISQNLACFSALASGSPSKWSKVHPA